MEDEDLARLAQTGDESAVLELWDRYKGLARWEGRRWAAYEYSTGAAAEDFLQAGFIALLRAVKYWKPGYTFKSRFSIEMKTEFLKTAGIWHKDALLIAERLEAPDRNGVTLADHLEAPPPPDDLPLSDHIKNALNTLTKPQREAIQAVIVEGTSRGMYADRRRLTKQVVSRHVQAGLVKMRRYLETGTADRPVELKVTDEQIIEALEACGGSVVRAAKTLGVGRTTIYNRLKNRQKRAQSDSFKGGGISDGTKEKGVRGLANVCDKETGGRAGGSCSIHVKGVVAERQRF